MVSKGLSRYLLFSTLFLIFSESLRVKSFIDLKFSYVIIIVNIILFLFLKQKTQYPKKAFWAILLIIILSLISFLKGNDTIVAILPQIIGISLSSFYFYNFFKFSPYSVDYIFDKYAKWSVVLAGIGIVIAVVHYLTGDFGYRLQSIFTEPAHFCGVMLPAFYYYLKNRDKNFYRLSIISFALILSLSSVGYLGMLVCLIIYRKKINILVNASVFFISIVLGVVIYLNVESFRLRIDDTLSSIGTFDVEDVNLSTYALVSNLYVATNVFKESPVIGNGIGSHQLSHKKYIYGLTGIDSFSEDFQSFNSEDANSLFIRILSDLGLIGIVLVITFIIMCYTKHDHFYVLSRAILVYFFYKLLREGHYFSPEMYFFVFAYFFIKKHSEVVQNNLVENI